MQLALFFHCQELMCSWYDLQSILQSQNLQPNTESIPRSFKVPLCFFSLSDQRANIVMDQSQDSRSLVDNTYDAWIQLQHDTVHFHRFFYVVDLEDDDDDIFSEGNANDNNKNDNNIHCETNDTERNQLIAHRIVQRLQIASKTVNQSILKQFFDDATSDDDGDDDDDESSGGCHSKSFHIDDVVKYVLLRSKEQRKLLAQEETLHNSNGVHVKDIWPMTLCAIMMLETHVPVCFWFERAPVDHKKKIECKAINELLRYQKSKESTIRTKTGQYQMRQILALLIKWITFNESTTGTESHVCDKKRNANSSVESASAFSALLSNHFDQSVLIQCYDTLKDLALHERQSPNWSAFIPLIQHEIALHFKAKIVTDDVRDGYMVKFLRLLQQAIPQTYDSSIWTIPFLLLERRELRLEFPAEVNAATGVFLAKHNNSTTSNKSADQQLLTSSPLDTNNNNRAGVYTVTIDPQHTRDFDDAISILDFKHGQYVHLEVLITNVCQIFMQDMEYSTETVLHHPIFKEALRRVTSTYICEWNDVEPVTTVFPMLPKSISNERLSLHQHQCYKVLAYEYVLYVDGTYDFKGVKLRDNIRIDCNMTYDLADELINRNSSDDFWFTLSCCCAAIRQKKVEKGASVFDDFSNSVSDGGDDNIHITDNQRRAKKSCTIITELSVMVNSDIAEYCARNNVPTLYKAQAATHIKHTSKSPTATMATAAATTTTATATTKSSKSNAGVAYITPVPSGNTLTASEYYTQQTSPVRRFLDLVSQSSVVHYLNSVNADANSSSIGYVPLFSHDLLESWSQHIETTTADRAALEKRIRYYWTLCHMKQHLLSLKKNGGDGGQSPLLMSVTFETYEKSSNTMRFKSPTLNNASILCTPVCHHQGTPATPTTATVATVAPIRAPRAKEQVTIRIVSVDPDTNRIAIQWP